MIALLGALLALATPVFAPSVPWTASERAALASKLDAALADPALRGAHVGLYAVPAGAGDALYARAADDAFQPASTLKLLVGSVALERLGPDHRFATDAVAGGALTDGTIDGPLIVRAGGDPSLGVADFSELAAALAARGTHVVRGGVAFDLARYEPEGYPPGWTIDDLAADYAPVIGALAFEHNVVRFTVAPGSAPGAPAVLTPLSPFASGSACGAALPLLVDAAITAPPGGAADLDVERTRAGCTRAIGTIPAGASPETLAAAITDPELYAGLALRDALRGAGITVSPQPGGDVPAAFRATAPRDPLVLWSHVSGPLRELLGAMWLPSDNLTAELLLEELGVAERGVPGTRAAGIAAEKAWLAARGVDVARIALADASGVSAYDRLTPRALVAICERDWAGPYRDVVLDALPVAGVRGTLAAAFRGTPAEGRIVAKTGSLSRARALAGYAANVRHGAIVFAFLVDEWTGDPAALEAVRERVAAALVAG